MTILSCYNKCDIKLKPNLEMSPTLIKKMGNSMSQSEYKQ